MHYDLAIVGAGILGLAHAYHAARRGLKVLVCERHQAAQGASIRNFGMIWPIGQPAGEDATLALRSREDWRQVLEASGIWHARCGSLHVAYHDDEAAVLREFVADPQQAFRNCEVLNPPEVLRRFPRIQAAGLRAGLFSPAEICVDPRRVIADLPDWLTKTHGVTLAFHTAVTGYDSATVRTTCGTFSAKRMIVCSGDEQQLLYPEAFARIGMLRCKLQMLRTRAYGNTVQVGTMLAAGLTLRHYKSFADCPTLPLVAARYSREMPEYERFGIHVLVSQNGHGEIVLGDSHEYERDIEIFNNERIDQLVLNYLRSFLVLPELEIAARWAGYYMKHQKLSYILEHAEPNVALVGATGGCGMTLAFGIAEKTLEHLAIEPSARPA